MHVDRQLSGVAVEPLESPLGPLVEHCLAHRLDLKHAVLPTLGGDAMTSVKVAPYEDARDHLNICRPLLA